MSSPDRKPTGFPELGLPENAADFSLVPNEGLMEYLTCFSQRLSKTKHDKYISNSALSKKLPYKDEEAGIKPAPYQVHQIAEKLRNFNIIPHYLGWVGRKHIVMHNEDNAYIVGAAVWLTKDRNYTFDHKRDFDRLQEAMGTDPRAEKLLPPSKTSRAIALEEDQSESVRKEITNLDQQTDGEDSDSEVSGKSLWDDMKRLLTPSQYLSTIPEVGLKTARGWTNTHNALVLDQLDAESDNEPISPTLFPLDIRYSYAAVYCVNEKITGQMMDLVKMDAAEMWKACYLMGLMFNAYNHPENLAEIMQIIASDPQNLQL